MELLGQRPETGLRYFKELGCLGQVGGENKKHPNRDAYPHNYT